MVGVATAPLFFGQRFFLVWSPMFQPEPGEQALHHLIEVLDVLWGSSSDDIYGEKSHGKIQH